jgi:hypothetical protein
MAAVAIVARPRLWLAGALLGITLLGRPDAERVAVAAPPPAVVIQLQPHSDFVSLEGVAVDRMNSGVGPLATWLGRLLEKLTGLGT